MDKERLKEYKRKYREEHKESIRSYMKQYRQDNKERIRSQQKIKRLTDGGERRRKDKERYWNNREEQLENRRVWGRENKVKVRAFKIRAGRKLRRKVRLDAFAVLGAKCVKCGFSDERALQVDHINGDGVAHRKQFKNQTDFYKHIIRGEIEGLQLLCANCNVIKRVENKEYGNYDFSIVEG